MKTKRILIGLALIIAIAFGFYKFNTYPKKIVARALYSVEGRAIEQVDNYFDGLELSEIYYDLKSEGNMNFSLFIDKGIFYKERLQLINTNNVLNKSKYLYKKYNRGSNYETFHEESVINNEVYIEDSNFSPYVFYIDSNTMNSLSKNSTAFRELGYNINKPNLFKAPKSFSDYNNELKKYVKDEYGDVLRSIKVRRVSDNRYKVLLEASNLKSLIDKTFEFYKTRDNFSYEKIAKSFDIIKKKLDRDLENRDELEIFITTDENGNLVTLYSLDKLYFFDFDDKFQVTLPDFRFRICKEKNEHYNTFYGYLNETNFRMSYYPVSQKFIYHDDKNLRIDGEFTDVYKGRSFKFDSKLKGTLLNQVAFRINTSPDKIERKSDAIEILKLNQSQWNELKNKRLMENEK